MISNIAGEGCPNGAGKDCICSREADEQRDKEQDAERKRAHSFDRLFTNFVWIAGVCVIVLWMVVDSFFLHPRPFELGNLAKTLSVVAACWLLMRFIGAYFATENAEKTIAKQELHVMQCAVRMLARREADENRKGTDLDKIHKKVDALMREIELMRRGE